MSSQEGRIPGARRGHARARDAEMPHALGDRVWDRPEHFLDQIVDAMADPLFVKDEQHRWVIVNKAFCDFMGYSREEMLGKSDFDFFRPEEAETFWEKDAEVFRSGCVNVNEEPVTDANGDTHVIVTKKSVFTDSSGRRILVGIIRDITELKNTQEELRAARDELELRVQQRTREVEEAQERLLQAQKMEVVGQLTGGLAHDFNNILAVVAGNIELAMESDTTPDELASFLRTALKTARRGGTLTQRLLAFSRRQALQPVPTDVGSLISDMEDLLRGTLGEQVRVELAHSERTTCALVDPAQLETAILNLAVNARDAMPDGGELRIDTARVVLEATHATPMQLEPGAHVLVEVTDTGAGIAPADVDKVFEPFFTTKPASEGSGLGLSMVYGFVKQSRGHVSVSSAPGKGTTVKLLLPEHDGPAEVGAGRRIDDRVEVPRGRGETLLVVEDDAEVRNLVALMLTGLGYEVHEAGSAAEALELVPTLERLDLLLSDVVLAGGSSGPELASTLTSARPDLRVLLMSGHVASAREDERLRRFRLLHKPFRRIQLALALRETLEGE